jgi:protein gp37
MFRDQKRFGQDPEKIIRAKDTTFKAPLKWNTARMVFTCSWSDFFIEEADLWRDEAWDIIKNTPHLTYQILTKRPENIMDRLPLDWGYGWHNVWLGVTVEDQRSVDVRIPLLMQNNSKIKFLSCEPLLENLEIFKWLKAYPIDWVIVGGESGPGARVMKSEWVRSLKEQCAQSSTSFFFKQWGGFNKKKAGRLLDGHEYSELPQLACI